MKANRRNISATIALAVVSAVALGGCQTEDPVAIPGDQPAPFQESVMGVNAEVGDVLLRSVHIEAPSDPRYQPGDDATVWFTLFNEGPRQDTLTSLTSAAAASAEIHWDKDCDGVAQTVPALPVQSEFPGLDKASGGVPPFDSYYGRLVDFKQQVLAGTSVPVTFTFADAGQVTVQALVQPSSAPRPAPTALCAAPAASSPAGHPSSDTSGA
jgi:copper(I)-binding protein